ncbi:ATG8-interacting protein 1 [Brachypodium distachyon]|uniref:ATG8-interacting protein 1 n=1 Tax=Brachypodium distachyon TaxID=15368 RepID=I1IVF8_BRADI|nr:ATG8-interacting protein 1 [Brachypodium distachyon]XP_010239596.1 ATG8-interacting protein 1 [Brachypodium distachyon]KQJ81412.1 hypothetical protein BRADI_5g00580v3 [Brachypodium distachyon]|eukprot:XP_003579746.1 ATG8-interacting protein 1 [Brachypodium distachyon]
MSDNEKDVAEGATSRGADWEVVTLTASAYAAAPGPGGTEGGPAAESKGLDTSKDGRGSSNALLMSDHFVFPPSEHENLPIETAIKEIAPEKDVQEESTSVEDDSFKNVGRSYDVGSERIQYYDEGKNLSVDEAELKGDIAEQGSFHAEDDRHGSVVHDDDNDDGDKSDKPSDSKSRDSGPPCQCWLKKHMSCLYDQAKETNALWSVVVAAALVGLVILWRKDKLHLNCLKWRSRSAVR